MSAVIAAPPRILTRAFWAPTDLLARFRRIGYLLLGLQLAGFLAWSTLLYSRFAVTSDFLMDAQALFGITHGNLDPINSLTGLPHWRSHAEFITWLLAPVYWAWPHSVLLLWLQDIGTVAAEMVAFTWLCEIAHRSRPGRGAAWLAAAGLLLLVANPWMWWAVTFDFHFESLAMPLIVLLARDLMMGRRRAWVWVVPLLAFGDVVGTYMVGAGLGGALANRRAWLRGLLVAATGLAAVLVITLVHANRGSGGGLSAYAYLAGAPEGFRLSLPALAKGVLSHPLGVLRAMWVKRLDIWANLAPAGVLGIGSASVLPLSLIVLLEDNLPVTLIFARPSFQSLPLYVLVPVGTVAVLAWISRRHRRLAGTLAALAAVQALLWAAVWVPRTPGTWLRVPAPTAATLAAVAAKIPASAEVVVSQGIMGRFSDHPRVYGLYSPTRGGSLAVHGQTWFVLAPVAGQEAQTTGSVMALAGRLAGPWHAALMTQANGVWAFRLDPPPGVHSLMLPGETPALPAWAAPLTPGEAGVRVMSGPPAAWHMTATGGPGYVADGIAWQKPPGNYQARVRLAASGPVNVEVWNDTGEVLLSRRSIPATRGVESVRLPVDARSEYPAHFFSGWGPFQAQLMPPLPGNRLEVRVWSPGHHEVSVYGAQLVAAGAFHAVHARGASALTADPGAGHG